MVILSSVGSEGDVWWVVGRGASTGISGVMIPSPNSSELKNG